MHLKATLFAAIVNSIPCTIQDCCVPSTDCAMGKVCPAVCNINLKCDGNIFDICQSTGPTVELKPGDKIQNITIPPNPLTRSEADDINSTKIEMATGSIAVTTSRKRSHATRVPTVTLQ